MSLDDLLASRRPSFGAWLTLGDAMAAEIMGDAGYDWLVVDLQHGALSWDRLPPVLHALDATRTPAFVRTPWNDPAQLMRAVDLGARGVIVPMVSTPDESRRAVEAVRYPPRGVRSFGRVRSDHLGPATDPVCMVMIETAEAMENLEAIAATPNLGGLFVGPADLSLSLGIPLGPETHPTVLDACERVAQTCERHGLVPGCAGLDAKRIEQLLDRGFRFLTVGGDGGFIRKGAAEDIRQVKLWREGRRT